LKSKSGRDGERSGGTIFEWIDHVQLLLNTYFGNKVFYNFEKKIEIFFKKLLEKF